MRIGDVMCNKKKHWDSFYTKYNDKDWWDNIIRYCKDNKIKRIYILSGAHHNLCLSESARYIENRFQFLKNELKDIKIVLKIGKSPDEDLIFCYNVKHFISTGGGYGKIIKLLNENKK